MIMMIPSISGRVPYFISSPSKDDGFLNREFRLFLQRSQKNLDPSDKFVKDAEKKEPFRFHFLKGADKNLRVRIQFILRGVRIKNGMSLSPQPYA